MKPEMTDMLNIWKLKTEEPLGTPRKEASWH